MDVSKPRNRFIGNFTIGSSVNIGKASITLRFWNCTQSNRNIIQFKMRLYLLASYITIKGGDFSGGNELIIVGGGTGATHFTLDSAILHDVSDEACSILIMVDITPLLIVNFTMASNLMISSAAGHSLISGNNFHAFGSWWSSHGIYVDHSTNNEIV